MLIRLTWSANNTKKLYENVQQSLDHLGLLGTVDVEIFDDTSYKEDLGIIEDPALCIEEESIEFRDMIFEGVIPEIEELNTCFSQFFEHLNENDVRRDVDQGDVIRAKVGAVWNS